MNVTSELYIDILFSLKRAAGAVTRYNEDLETNTLFCGAVDGLHRSFDQISENGSLGFDDGAIGEKFARRWAEILYRKKTMGQKNVGLNIRALDGLKITATCKRLKSNYCTYDLSFKL